MLQAFSFEWLKLVKERKEDDRRDLGEQDEQSYQRRPRDQPPVLRKLANNGNVILVGRAGAIITGKLPYVLHVRLVAPFEFRARNYARSNGISEEEAARAMRANDEASRRYVRLYFRTNVKDPLHYDLVVNTGRNGFGRAAHMICTGVQDLVAKARGEDAVLYPAESFGSPDVQSESRA